VITLVGGDVGVGPCGERVHLDDAATDVEMDNLRVCARRRLDATQAGHPRLLAAQGARERLDLAHRTALVLVGLPQVVGRDQRLHDREVQVVTLSHALDVPERLGEVVLRVEEHDLDARSGLRREIDQDTVLERRREHDARAEALPRPFDRTRRGLALELGRGARELAEVDVDQRSINGNGIEQAHVAAHSPSPTSAT
jgi:hypothetical protein